MGGGKARRGEIALLGDVLGLLEEVVPEVSGWMAKFHARLAACAHGYAALWSVTVVTYTKFLGKSCVGKVLWESWE